MRVALRQFLNQVDSIERTIELRDNLVQFGLQPQSNLDPAAETLRQLVRQIGLGGMQKNLDGAVLLLAAALEQFVSDVMIAYASDLSDIVPQYADLPNAIRTWNERQTGEALSRRRRTGFTQYDRQRFVENLGKCQAGSVPYVLNGEAIALNDRNLTQNVLKDLFERLGVSDIWDVVGSTSSLNSWSGAGGSGAAISRAKNEINELIDNRNQIAHSVGSVTPGSEVIRSYVTFQRALAQSLVEGLEAYANSLRYWK